MNGGLPAWMILTMAFTWIILPTIAFVWIGLLTMRGLRISALDKTEEERTRLPET